MEAEQIKEGRADGNILQYSFRGKDTTEQVQVSFSAMAKEKQAEILWLSA